MCNDYKTNVSIPHIFATCQLSPDQRGEQWSLQLSTLCIVDTVKSLLIYRHSLIPYHSILYRHCYKNRIRGRNKHEKEPRIWDKMHMFTNLVYTCFRTLYGPFFNPTLKGAAPFVQCYTASIVQVSIGPSWKDLKWRAQVPIALSLPASILSPKVHHSLP